MSKVMELQKDQLLFAEGDTGQEMYIIMEGKVQVFLLREEFQVILATLEKGHFFGEMSLLEGESRSAGVMAVEPTKLIIIDQSNFQNFIKQNPNMTIKIMKGLSQRLRQSNEQIFKLKQELACKNSIGTETKLKPTRKQEEAQAKAREPKSPVSTQNTGKKELPPQVMDALKQQILQFANEKQITCPVCQHNFVAFSLNRKNLKLIRRDYWLREYYEKVEPLWFKHSCCPSCYFAAPQEIFEEVGLAEGERLKAEEAIRKSKVSLAPPPLVNPNQAIGFYQLADMSLGDKEEYQIQRVENCLELASLYREANRVAEEQETLVKAFQLLKANVELGRGNNNLLQKSLYWQGLISIRMSKTDQAIKLIRQAAKVDGLNRTIVYILSKKIEEKLSCGMPLKI